jgi:hypothetical protein
LADTSSEPDGLNATDVGPTPAWNGDPGTGASAPRGPTSKTDMLFDERFAVASSLPPGANATDCGAPPVANGDPGAGAKTGVAAAAHATGTQHSHAKASAPTRQSAETTCQHRARSRRMIR